MTPRRRTLLLFIVFLGLLALLAASLNGVVPQNGEKFNFNALQRDTISLGGSFNAGVWPMIIKAIMALATVLMPAYIIYMLIDKERRKRLLIDMIIFGIVLGLLSLMQDSLKKNVQLEGLNLPAITADLTPQPTLEAAPIPLPPVPGDGTVAAVAVAVSTVAVAGGSWFIFKILGATAAAAPLAMMQIAAQAEETIDALIIGKDLHSTILLCYKRMTEIAAKSRNLPRDVFVTPHEFEAVLVQNGLPAPAVQDLTRIFEEVRYGDRNVGDDERNRAVTALRVIAAVCKPEEKQE